MKYVAAILATLIILAAAGTIMGMLGPDSIAGKVVAVAMGVAIYFVVTRILRQDQRKL